MISYNLELCFSEKAILLNLRITQELHFKPILITFSLHLKLAPTFLGVILLSD